jgi:hypothetical protein
MAVTQAPELGENVPHPMADLIAVPDFRQGGVKILCVDRIKTIQILHNL